MKKLLLVLTLVSLFSFRNSDSKDEANYTMVGKWSLQKAELVKSTDGSTQSQEISECSKKTIHEFTLTKNISTFYAIINNVCTLTGEVNTRNYYFDKANMKFWYENEQDFPYYIIKLNNTDFVFEDRTQDQDGDNKPDIIRRYFL